MRSRDRAAVRISGVPEIQLVFTPGVGVALRVAWDGASVPDLVEYEHLSTDVVRTGHMAWAALLIDDHDVGGRRRRGRELIPCRSSAGCGNPQQLSPPIAKWGCSANLLSSTACSPRWAVGERSRRGGGQIAKKTTAMWVAAVLR